MTKRKWANKSRGLRYHSQGEDVYGAKFHVQDESWACFPGVRIYAYNSSNEQEEICLWLKVSGAKALVKGLLKFIKENE